MTTLDEELAVATTGSVQEATSEPAAHRESVARRFAHNPAAMVGLAVLGVLVVCAVFGDWLVPYDPNAQDLRAALQGPSASHWAGTDELGRDVLSRLIDGASVSVKAAFLATFIGFAVGAPLGVFAGYVGRFPDAALSRINDGLMAIPAIVLALGVVAALGTGLTKVMIAIGVLFTPIFFRVARSATISVREETYIEASRALGCTRFRVLWRHVFPNVLSPLVVQVALLTGVAIAAEATLSYLGMGVEQPQASWGSMIQMAARGIDRSPWVAVFPGVVITVTVMALTLVGDGLRDALGTVRRRKAKVDEA